MKKLLIIPMLFMCSMVIGQSKKIIGKPIRLQKFEVAQHDFPPPWFVTHETKTRQSLLPSLVSRQLSTAEAWSVTSRLRECWSFLWE